MKKEKFVELLGNINENYIKEAETIEPTKKSVWLKWGAIAACLAIIVYAGVRLFPKDTEIPRVLPDLPLISIENNGISGMGFEGYLAHDISELVNANPWDDSLKIDTLPVYRNPLTYDKHYPASSQDADPDKMQELLLEVADKLGIDTANATIEPTFFYDNGLPPYDLEIKTDELTVEVDQTLTAYVSFKPAIPFPEEYNYTYDASYDEITAAAKYLKTKFSNLIILNNPQTNITGGDYDFDGRQTYNVEFFEGSENIIEQIVNYNFNRVEFYCYNNEISGLRIYKPDLSEKVGDYPIITVDEAYKLLADGQYASSSPYELPGLKYVKKVELIYLTDQYESYYMPYYRFYVELPEEHRAHGLTTYGAYYVPAVVGSYITNMPTYDGRFN